MVGVTFLGATSLFDLYKGPGQAYRWLHMNISPFLGKNTAQVHVVLIVVKTKDSTIGFSSVQFS